MKKILFAVSVLSIMLVGCGGPDTNTDIDKEPVVEKTKISKIKNPDFKDIPAWILQPEYANGIAAVGQATIGDAGSSFARTEALANARNELARQIQVEVDTMFKSYLNTTGVGGDQTVDKVASEVSKQVASVSLRGSKQINFWVSEKNELYVLVGVDNSVLNQQTKETIINKKALYQEIKAQEAQEELEAAIDAKFKINY